MDNGALVWLLFILGLMLLIFALTSQWTTSEIVAFVVFAVIFFTIIATKLFSFSRSLNHERNYSSVNRERFRNPQWRPTPSMTPRVNTHDQFWLFGATIMAEREQYRNVVSPPSFGPRAQIAQTAIRALPLVKSFCNVGSDQGGDKECPICMENFKEGDLIQPFGLCIHEFHSSCLNSWLHRGKTTCPVCRQDLSSTSIKTG